jgi:hypothetical protein
LTNKSAKSQKTQETPENLESSKKIQHARLIAHLPTSGREEIRDFWTFSEISEKKLDKIRACDIIFPLEIQFYKERRQEK